MPASLMPTIARWARPRRKPLSVTAGVQTRTIEEVIAVSRVNAHDVIDLVRMDDDGAPPQFQQKEEELPHVGRESK